MAFRVLMHACARNGDADNNIYSTKYHSLTPGKDEINNFNIVSTFSIPLPLLKARPPRLPDRSSSLSTKPAELVEECECIFKCITICYE